MITTAAQIHEIAKEIIGRSYDYDYIGLRIQDSQHGLTVGQQVEHESSVWYDGEESDETVGGICAVDANLAARQVLEFGAYSGNVIIVLGCNRAVYGEDDGEIVMQYDGSNYPVVLDIF